MAEANAAILAGMLPFGSVVVRDGTIISRAGRQTLNSSTGHAEVLAMGKLKLSGCTLYSTVEPGAMCSFIAREAQVARVVYGLSSSIMGGHTRWPILQAFLGRLVGHRWRKVTSTGERVLCGPEKRTDQLRGVLGPLGLRAVPGAGDDAERGAGKTLGVGRAVGARHHTVALAP